MLKASIAFFAPIFTILVGVSCNILHQDEMNEGNVMKTDKYIQEDSFEFKRKHKGQWSSLS